MLRLTPGEFTYLWSKLALPARPLELNPPEPGATLTEVANLAHSHAATLRAKTVLIGDDPSPKAASLLHGIANRTAQVDLRWTRRGLPERRGLVAMRTKHDVSAMWTGDEVVVRGIEHAVYASVLLSELGAAEPARTHSISVPAAVLKAAAHRDPGRFQSRLVAAGISRDDARVLSDFATADRQAAGQIGASRLDRWGALTRATWVIHVVDTARGRYATYERAGYRTLISATDQRLTSLINELYTDITPK